MCDFLLQKAVSSCPLFGAVGGSLIWSPMNHRAKYKVFASKFADCRDEWELSFFQQCKAVSFDIPTTGRGSISDQMKVHLHLLFRQFAENSDNYHMINTGFQFDSFLIFSTSVGRELGPFVIYAFSSVKNLNSKELRPFQDVCKLINISYLLSSTTIR